MYLSDVGLLRVKFGISSKILLTNNDVLNQIKGVLAENYVSNALLMNEFEVYYWESDGKAEVDFVCQTSDGHCIPIEVKSADNVR